MADKTRAEMISFVLEYIGVKAANVSARTEDSTLAGTVIDSLHSRLRKEGLAPFLTSEFPAWAQVPFAEIAGAELAPAFRIGGEMFAALIAAREHGYRELQKQVAGYRHPVTIKTNYY